MEVDKDGNVTLKWDGEVVSEEEYEKRWMEREKSRIDKAEGLRKKICGSKGILGVDIFQILIGIGLAATAISIPISIVSKHFPLNKRTIAIGVVTAAGSFGYFVSPIYTRFFLLEFGWNPTLLIFGAMILAGLVVSLFLTTPMTEFKQETENNQTAMQAIKEAFSNKSFNYLTLGFFVCGWHIALVATHIPMHIRDKGLEDWTATAILALIGLFNIFGTLTSGYLSTRISKKKLLSAIYLLRGVSIIK